jgi:hypothetical protein
MKVKKEDATQIVYAPAPPSGGAPGGPGISMPPNVRNVAPPPPPQGGSGGEPPPEIPDLDKIKDEINKGDQQQQQQQGSGQKEKLTESEKDLAKAVEELAKKDDGKPGTWNPGKVTEEDLSKIAEGQEAQDGPAGEEHKSKQKGQIIRRREDLKHKPEDVEAMYGSKKDADVLIERYKPLVNWRKELKKFITTFGKKTKFSQVNRRFIGRSGVQRGISGKKKIKDKIKDLVVAIDTSGSMTPDDIMLLMSEVCNILKSVRVKKFYMLLWHTKAYNLIKVEGGKCKPTLEDIEIGGTDINAVWKGLKNYGLKPNAMIIFTDGGFMEMPTTLPSEIAKGGNNIKWAWLYYPPKVEDDGLFVRTDGKSGYNNIPYGDLIPLNTEKFLTDLRK